MLTNLKVMMAIGALCVLTASAAWAQAVAGSQVSGAVRDSSGGALPGAEVTITKTDTAAVRTVFTDENGAYVIPNLPVGPYQLKVALQGFNTYVQDGIVLQVSSNPQINVTLAIGAVSEQVTVTANATMVETHSTGIGQVVDNQRVIELPLNGRQATELIFLAGLATSAPAGDLNTNKNYPTVTISVAGGQANGMTYIMDGGTHNDPFNNLNLPTPFPDALQEFKVETSALPARYGHHAASAVNVITKSGTNLFKGSAFAFNRNYRFNARNAFALERDSLKRNQFGGVLGGPVAEEQGVLLRRLSGQDRAHQPGHHHQLRADAGDAAGRLHRVRVAGVQRRTAGDSDRRVRQQPDRSGAAEQRRAQFRALSADGHRRSLRPRAVRHPEQQHRASEHRQGRLHAQQSPEHPGAVSLRRVRQPGDV